MTAELPHHCRKCRGRWGGYTTAHCGACCETFSTVANFDAHRDAVHGVCVPPRKVKPTLVYVRPGVWGRADERAHHAEMPREGRGVTDRGTKTPAGTTGAPPVVLA